MCLTKENAKYYCRTCLTKLITKNGTKENRNHIKELDSNEPYLEDLKDFCINISTNNQLHYLLLKYIGEQFCLDGAYDIPQNVCIDCYDKLQSFDKFCKRALESAEKLSKLFSDNKDLKDTLREPEAVWLENIVKVEEHCPDPFGTTDSANNNNFQSKEIAKLGLDYVENIEDKSNMKIANNSKTIKNVENVDNEETAMNSGFDSEECCSSDMENDTEIQKMKKRRSKRITKLNYPAKTEKPKIRGRPKGTKNNLKCDQCLQGFAHKINLDGHVRKVHEGLKRPFQCNQCNKSYEFISTLKMHIKEKHEIWLGSYACDYLGCDRIYTSSIALQRHKRLKHRDAISLKKYDCELCGAMFTHIGKLKIHRSTKHPTAVENQDLEKFKERFECRFCNKSFNSRYTLKYHILRLHSTDMEYECNVCGRRMPEKWMLVQHMQIHSPCEHCGKQFIRKFELESHIRNVHMNLKPFECQYCSRSFAVRKTLKHHEYIHTGEKPYVCNICGQAYRQKFSMQKHCKSHEKKCSGIAESKLPLLESSQQMQLPSKGTLP